MAQEKRDGAKAFNKGSHLFKQGEPARKLFLIQTGLVSVTMTRPSGQVEIFQAAAPQVIGIEALNGAKTYENSAVALNDTFATEIPAETGIQALNGNQATLKLLTTGLLNKHNSILSVLRNMKLADTLTPCPPEAIPKLFASIFHVVSYTATPKDGMLKVVWPAFRKYCQRVFAESPVRLEQTIYLLSTLGYAKLEMVPSDTDPEAPEELGFVHFKDIDQLENFSDFFRTRLKHLGPVEAMNLKDPSLQTSEALLRAFGANVKDAAGLIRIPVNEAVNTLKTELGQDSFEVFYFESLIGRGLQASVFMSGAEKLLEFSPDRIKKSFRNWRILSKITEWNNTGRAPGMPEPDPKKGSQK